MNDCEQVRSRFVEALYNELDAAEKARLDLHMKECPACAGELTAMRSTLDVMDLRKRPEQAEPFWSDFDRKLQQRMRQAEQPEVIPFRRKIPSWVWQAAAAVILVGLGVVIGRFYLKESNPPVVARETPKVVRPVQAVSADVETKRFLERSEVLLLGVLNTDPSERGTEFESSLARQKKVSRDLIQEASVVKAKLNDPRQRRLRGLVSDLEVILMQIANLEAEEDQPEIEVLRSGVDRKGLLLKINLEQLRLSSPETPAPASTQTAKGPAI